MSGGSPDTRQAILQAAWSLLKEEGFAGFTMGRVASRAGVSRQAVYLHFSSRTALLLALVDEVDRTGRLPGLLADAMAHRDPVERLVGLVRAAATYVEDVAEVALALRAARDLDEAARAAWADRAADRRRHLRAAVQDVADAGRLDPSWTVETATDLLFALCGYALYEVLVRDLGWPHERYVAFTERAVRRLVLAG